MKEADLKAFDPRREMGTTHAPSIEQVNLVDMGNVDHRKRPINQNVRSSLFVCFANGSLSRGFTVFHKAGGERPETMPWLNGASAEQYPTFPFSDATDHEARVFVVDVPTRFTDVPRECVSRRDRKSCSGAAALAELDHDYRIRMAVPLSLPLSIFSKSAKRKFYSLSFFALRQFKWLQ